MIWGIAVLLLTASELLGQGAPTKEYIRVNGRLVAIESAATSGGTWDATAMQVTVPGTPPLVGASFSASVQVRNAGTQTWQNMAANPTGGVRLKSTDTAIPARWGASTLNMTPSSLAAGANTTFTLSGTAPNLPGLYPFRWRMERADAGEFGATAEASTGGNLEVRTSAPTVLDLRPLTSPPQNAPAANEATFTGRFSGGAAAVKRLGLRFISHGDSNKNCSIEVDLQAGLVKLYQGYLPTGAQTASLGSTGMLAISICEVRMGQTTAEVQGTRWFRVFE
jgi:hypothetical protein